MYLSIDQVDVFFDAMDALLAYTNDRFDVVEGYALDYDDPLVEAKAALVARELWDNPAIIDDFVAENPYRLSARALELAASWKDALPGTYTLMRYSNGNALVMGEAGVFSVCGISEEPSDTIGAIPATLEMVLIPFEGIITYDGFLTVGNVSPLVERRLADEFEAKCAAGIHASAEELVACARRAAEEREAKGLDEFLASLERDAARSGGEEVLPVGFHRGVLAGVTGEKRRAAVEKHSISLGFLPPEAPKPPLGMPEAVREQCERAVMCASAAVAFCGVASLDECYRQYVQVYHGTFGEADFHSFLAHEAGYGDMSFDFWFDAGTPYLIHYTLSEPYVREQAMKWQAEGTLRGTVADELDNIDRLLAFLVEEHTRFAMKPLPFLTPEHDELDLLMENRSVVALHDFLDAHVPDQEDDYFFADAATEEFVMSAVETGDLQALLAFATELGLDGCCDDPVRLRRLIENVHDNMPCWENNGWSQRELKEQLTGKKVFYDETGAVMRVGSNDPCPCGSGKTYKDCCGR